MPAAETNGKDGETETLVWETGLSKFIGNLEEDIVRWHAEERKKAKERQTKGAASLKDAAAAEEAVSNSAAAKVAKLSVTDPWNERLEAIVLKATLQREEMRQLLAAIKEHVSNNLSNSAFLDKLPATTEGTPLAASGDETLKHLKSFLELVDKKTEDAAPAGEGRRRRRHRDSGNAEGGGAAKDDAKDDAKDETKDDAKDDAAAPRRSRSRSPKGEQRGEQRPARRADDADDYEYSDSRSRSPRRGPPAGDNARRRDDRAPSADSREDEYSYYSEADDYSDCDPEPRRGGRGGRDRPPRRDDGPRRGGRGRRGGRRDDGPRRDDRPRRDGGGRRGRRGGSRRGGGGGGKGGDGRRRPEPSGDIQRDIDRFVKLNKLDERCEDTLRDLPKAQAEKVMGLGPNSNHKFELSGDIRDPTAVVMARIRKVREEGGKGGGGGGGRRDRGGGGRKGGGRRPRSRGDSRDAPRGGQRRRRGDRRDGSRGRGGRGRGPP